MRQELFCSSHRKASSSSRTAQASTQQLKTSQRQLVAALPDVDVAVINGNYAIEGGLHVSQALAVEANDGLAAKTYGNIIATSEAKANDAAVKTLVEVLQGPEVAKFIKEKYDGAVVPLFG